MAKNCWEAKACGREPGGTRVRELGECPAAKPSGYDGINRGKYAGRYCWMVEGTLCHNEIQGNWAKKIGQCVKCDFFNETREEEGSNFRI